MEAKRLLMLKIADTISILTNVLQRNIHTVPEAMPISSY
jgi:hypothetical protein